MSTTNQLYGQKRIHHHKWKKWVADNLNLDNPDSDQSKLVFHELPQSERLAAIDRIAYKVFKATLAMKRNEPKPVKLPAGAVATKEPENNRTVFHLNGKLIGYERNGKMFIY